MEKTLEESNKKPKPGEWSETCIGYWSRSTFHSRNNNKITQNVPVCNGINIVKIKNLDLSLVVPSNTNGFQVLIQEHEDQKQIQKVKDGSTGFELIYNSYQKKLFTLQGYWSKFKESSDVVTTYAKNIHDCPNKFERINSIVTDECRHLKDWFTNSWK